MNERLDLSDESLRELMRGRDWFDSGIFDVLTHVRDEAKLVQKEADAKFCRAVGNYEEDFRSDVQDFFDLADALDKREVVDSNKEEEKEVSIPRMTLIEAGVDPSHQIDHCDYCGKKFVEPAFEAHPTCTRTKYVTLCERCYRQAGNTVR